MLKCGAFFAIKLRMNMSVTTMSHNTFNSNDVLESLSTSVLILDSALRVSYINTATEILFEISQRQAENIPLQTLLPGEKKLFKSSNERIETRKKQTEKPEQRRTTNKL